MNPIQNKSPIICELDSAGETWYKSPIATRTQQIFEEALNKIPENESTELKYENKYLVGFSVGIGIQYDFISQTVNEQTVVSRGEKPIEYDSYLKNDVLVQKLNKEIDDMLEHFSKDPKEITIEFPDFVAVTQTYSYSINPEGRLCAQARKIICHPTPNLDWRIKSIFEAAILNFEKNRTQTRQPISQ